jgi:hypothetical protein
MKKTRIMYIESKGEDVTGPGRIGRVTFSKSERSVYYHGRMFCKTARAFGKANYYDAETGEEYWISGCKKNGGDRLYSGTIEIDDDVREEYWTEIRKMPERRDQYTVRVAGKYSL